MGSCLGIGRGWAGFANSSPACPKQEMATKFPLVAIFTFATQHAQRTLRNCTPDLLREGRYRLPPSRQTRFRTVAPPIGLLLR